MDKDRIKEITSKLIGEFHERKIPSFTPREVEFPNIPHKIQVAIGMRRVGKTSFLFQEIQKLIKNKIPKQQIIYFNFEDDRLLPMNHKQLGEMIDTFYEIYPTNYNKKCYLFLDEIQNIPNWPVVIRRLHDTKNVQIYLTGSSAKLLSKEISSNLRGRSIATEIWPFSLTEYAKHNKIKLPTRPLGPRRIAEFKNILKKYLITGGFPEAQALTDINHRKLLQDYVNSVIYRDIVDRYNLSNISLLKTLIKTMFKTNGSLFSIHKWYMDFKSQGLQLSKNTLHDYLGYVEDSYLSFSLPLFAESLRKQNSNPRKIYPIDTGLYLANTFNFQENLGTLFENLIYIDLRRKGFSVYYYKTKENNEIDFIVETNDGNRKIYQVCWDMNNEQTSTREMRASKRAHHELNFPYTIITPENYLEEIATL